MSTVALDLEQMSFEDRLELAERVWRSLRTEPERIRISEAQARELDRRLADLEEDPKPGKPWRDVLDALPSRQR